MKELLKITLLLLVLCGLISGLAYLNRPKFSDGNLVQFSGTYGHCIGVVRGEAVPSTPFTNPVYEVEATCTRVKFKIKSNVPQAYLARVTELN